MPPQFLLFVTICAPIKKKSYGFAPGFNYVFTDNKTKIVFFLFKPLNYLK